MGNWRSRSCIILDLEVNSGEKKIPKMTYSSSLTETTYRIRNWSEYDAALKQRGSITFWVSEEAIANWIHPEKTGKRGASPLYTDLAIAP